MKGLILLQEGAPASGGGMTTLLMYGAIAVIFYLFMIRPQIKRTKDAKKFRENLTVGDKVVTTGGIHGKILEVTDSTFLISSDGTKLRIDKNSISPNAIDQLQGAK